MKFRPTFWPTVFTVPAVLLMLGLSIWQVQRLQWKEALIAERTQRTSAPAIALPGAEALGLADLAGLEYRHVQAPGQFANDKEIFLGARTFEGSAGYHVITPFRFADGRTVLVDRGWIPLDRKEAIKRSAGQIDGPTLLDGVIRLQGRQTWFVPDNRPDLDFFFWIDLPAMAKLAALPAIETRFYVEAGQGKNAGGLPIGGQTVIDLPNDHLQYAITWFCLAIALVVIYVLYHRGLAEKATAPKTEAPE